MESPGRAEQRGFEMPQEVTLRAAEFQNGPDVRAWLDAVRAQVSRDAIEQDVPGWVNLGGPKPVGDLIACRVRQMIRPEEPVERDGIAAPQIGEHPHGELESERGRQLLASDEGDQPLPRGQRKRAAQSPGCLPARRPQRTSAHSAEPVEPKE